LYCLHNQHSVGTQVGGGVREGLATGIAFDALEHKVVVLIQRRSFPEELGVSLDRLQHKVAVVAQRARQTFKSGSVPLDRRHEQLGVLLELRSGVDNGGNVTRNG
jgi:hypothetical protein